MPNDKNHPKRAASFSWITLFVTMAVILFGAVLVAGLVSGEGLQLLQVAAFLLMAVVVFDRWRRKGAQ
jgi:hypothetical protein